MSAPSTADRLLDAQVAWSLARMTGPEFPAQVESDLLSVLDAAARTRLDAVIDADEVKGVARRLLAQVPPSVTATTITEMLVGILHAGPSTPYTPAELIDRESLEKLLDAVPASTVALGEILDRLSTNPQVASIAAGFVGQIVNDVVATNRAVAERIPGVSSLVSFGASAAGRMMGAADKPIDALIGGTAARGAGYVTRRLNRIILDTLREPSTRDAILAVYDQYADQPLPPLSDFVSAADAVRIGGMAQEALIEAAPSAPVAGFIDAVVDGFLALYGEHSVAALIEEMGLSAAEVAADLAPPLVRSIQAMHEADALAPMLRRQLEPFYASAEVARILGGADEVSASS